MNQKPLNVRYNIIMICTFDNYEIRAANWYYNIINNNISHYFYNILWK